MADETYINVDSDVVYTQDPGPRGDRQRAGTIPSEALPTKTSEIQQEFQKTRPNESNYKMWICPLGFTAMCVLQLCLNIFLRLHYVSPTEVDKLKADISNLTSVKLAQIEQLEAELNNLTRMKSAEIDQLKAELKNLTRMKSAEEDRLKAELKKLTRMKSAEVDQLKADRNSCIKERDQLHQDNQELKSSLCRLEGTCEGWVGFKSSTYYVSTEKKSWGESRQDCKDRGADLVVINSEDEQRFLHGLLDSTWIGLSDQNADRVFHWVDNNIPSTTYWGIDQPTYENELCVMIYRYFQQLESWFDRPCEESMHWICEKHRFLM